MKTFTRDLDFVNFNGSEMEWVKFNNVVVYEAFKKLIASGVPPITLQKCKSANLVDYKIYGNSVQNGTPTYATPIEIESVGEQTKNLFDVKEWFPDYVNDENGITYTNKEFSKIHSIKILNGEFKEKTQYTISLDYEITNSDNNGFTLIVYDTNDARIAYKNHYTVTGNENGRTVLTTNANTTIGYIRIAYNTSQRICNVKLKNIQIEENTTSTDFEPYGYRIPVKVNDTITNIYLNEPLRKIENYKDIIDFEKKQVIRKIYNEFITNVDTKSSTSSTYSMFLSEISKVPLLEDDTGYCISNKFKKALYRYVQTPRYPNIIQTYLTSSRARRVVYTFDDASINTVALAKEKIGDGFDVCYVLQKEITEDIELPNILLNKGINRIEIDTNILPSNIEIKYYGKTNLLLLNEEENIILNSILADNTETEKDITDTEINQILDEIIGG